MPSDVIEPPAGSTNPGATGQPHTDPEIDHPDRPVLPADEGQAPGRRASMPTPSAAEVSSSEDELSVSLIQARPDPALGEFVDGSAPEDRAATPAAPATHPPHGPAAGAKGPAPLPPVESQALDALAGLDPAGKPGAPSPPVAGLSPSSYDAVKGLDLDVRPSAKRRRKRVPADQDDDALDDDGAPAAPWTPWALMLLASYASAVTLGLIWVLWTGRHVPETVEPDLMPAAPADTRPDPGLRADRSRQFAPPTILPAAHIVTLGETVQLGQVAATPLAVFSGRVQLERQYFSKRETRRAGENALKLLLRLRNVSKDRVIAPLDEAFLRDRPRADPDSYIETSKGGPPIGQFQLAVESEWSIVGQEFRELRPGEVLETMVVSDRDALARKAPEMTWRIRLRTDIDHTDDLGVRFRDSDIQREP
jgi:hypothetical protein